MSLTFFVISLLSDAKTLKIHHHKKELSYYQKWQNTLCVILVNELAEIHRLKLEDIRMYAKEAQSIFIKNMPVKWHNYIYSIFCAIENHIENPVSDMGSSIPNKNTYKRFQPFFYSKTNRTEHGTRIIFE